MGEGQGGDPEVTHAPDHSTKPWALSVYFMIHKGKGSGRWMDWCALEGL